MSQIIPIYIPTYISDAAYKPARVLPRLLFYNGMVDCESWYLESGSLTQSGVTYEQTAFPYFDNYNVVSGSFPTEDSLSLLFNNEGTSYGIIPSGSLYTNYWETYISLLYNPKTRLLNCSAIIPLADYTKMELNDIVNFRGNYYHLRAINEYSLKTGDCQIQLLGPIIAGALDGPNPPLPPPLPTTSSIVWSNITDSDVTSYFRLYDNGVLIESSSVTEVGSLFVSASHILTAELEVYPFPDEGAVTMSINVNGGTTIAVSSSLDAPLSTAFFVQGGTTYYITGSVDYPLPAPTDRTWDEYSRRWNQANRTWNDV
jgi:hypothetical protein